MFVLCTENLSWLLHVRFAAPRAARWPSFPDIGDHRVHHVQLVLAGLWRSHASLGGLRRSASDVQHVARHLRHRLVKSLARLAGLPWRGQLPFELAQHCPDLGAEGICVQKWLPSGHLVEDAHRGGLHVNTWTINDAVAAQAAAAAGMREAASRRAVHVAANHHRVSPGVLTSHDMTSGPPITRCSASASVNASSRTHVRSVSIT
jgi:hypothetical protein